MTHVGSFPFGWVSVPPPLSVFNTPMSTSSVQFIAVLPLLKGNGYFLILIQGGVVLYRKEI